MTEKLIETIDLKKHYEVSSGPFYARKKKIVRAVDGVSLHVMKGETLGVLGESGCGKSTLGRMILGLVRPDSGKVLYRGRELRGICTDLQIVFAVIDDTIFALGQQTLAEIAPEFAN